MVDYRTAEDAAKLFEEIYAVYREAFTEPPHSQAEEQLQDFVDGYPRHVQSPGFRLETAYFDRELIGFAYGSPRPADWWWNYGDREPPPEVLPTPKFAIFEWAVRRQHRGRGVGRTLLMRLLDGRPESHATLWSHPESHAHQIYLHLGWYQVGIHRRPGWPPMRAMVLRLDRP